VVLDKTGDRRPSGAGTTTPGAEAGVGLLTVVFTDVERSTEMATTLGDEAAREALRVHEDVVRRMVAEHEGREVRGMGDGFMLCFAIPRRAISCAVAIQRELARHNQRARVPVRVRIGMNTGEVLQEPHEIYGEAVNAAARITAKADGGEVLASEVVRQLAGTMPGLSFVDRGRFRLKGFSDRWRLYQVRWEPGGEEAAPPILERLPLVGRDHEKARLIEYCRAAISGNGRLVLVGGEAGIGKSRLVEEVMNDATQLGMLPLLARCHEGEGTVPYAPVIGILEQAMRGATVEQIRATLGDAAPQVARVTPELRRLLPDLPPPLDLPPEQERRYLFGALRDVVDRVSRFTPLLLVVDDIQWADFSTLLLLEHLGETVRALPVLLIGIHRDVDVDAEPSFVRVLENLIRGRLADQLTLKHLSPDGVEAMLRALSRRVPPRGFADIIAAKTDGNPFFVEEVYRHLFEEGRLFDERSRWRSDLDLDDIAVPRSVRLVVGRRLERLSEPGRAVLATAAGIGRAFDFELLEVLVDVDADTLLDAVDEAERARLITSTERARSVSFTFAHELIRETLLAELSLPRRQRLHLSIAEAMERAYGSAAEDHATEIAYHLTQASSVRIDHARTVHYLRTASARALRAAAFEDALRQLDTALELVGHADDVRAALLADRGSALQGLGLWGDAMTAWRSALDIYERLGDTEVPGPLCARMALQLGWSARMLESLEVTSRGLSLVGEQPSPARALLLAIAANAFAYSGNAEMGQGLAEEAIQIAEAVGDDRVLGFALSCRAFCHLYWSEPRECLAVGDKACDKLRAAGDGFTLVSMRAYMAVAHAVLGDIEEFEAVDRQVARDAQAFGNHGATAVHLVNRGVCAIVASDLGQVERTAEDYLRFCRDHDLSWALMMGYLVLGLADFWRGAWDEALVHFDAATGEIPLEGAYGAAGPAFRLLTLADLGRDEEVAPAGSELRSTLGGPDQPLGLGQVALLSALVQVLWMTGRREQAAALRPFLTPLIEAGMSVDIWDLHPLGIAAGIAAAAGDQWDEAEEHFHCAIAEAERMGHRIAGAEARRWYATILLKRGAEVDAPRARRLVDQAVSLYRQVGMPRHEALAQAALAEL